MISAVRTLSVPVRFHEVVNGRPLLEKLRVGDHVELDGDPPFVLLFSDRFPNPVGGPHRHRRFIHDDLEALHLLPDHPGNLQNMLQISGPILAGRGPHRDEVYERRLDGRCHIGGE
jgi:hypothetical protein